MNPDQIRTSVNATIDGSIPREPRSIYDPVRAVLESGGKRARPILTAYCAGAASERAEIISERSWLPAAAAVELLHTFTLVHDDIMDNATTRRGRPTTHLAYGLNTAILTGDTIVALALESLSRSLAPSIAEMTSEFGAAFRSVCEGQALDKDFENRDEVGLREYLDMIELKTSRIFELAAVLGALTSGADRVDSFRLFARQVGLAFQLQDDLLDVTGGQEFGKTIGGDILEGKRSILFVLAMESFNDAQGEDRGLLGLLRERKAGVDDIVPIKRLFERLGVLERAARMAKASNEKAMEHLSELEDSDLREKLTGFSQWLLGREF